MKGSISRRLNWVSYFVTALSCLLLLLTTGCATQKNVEVHQPTHVGLGRYKTATVEIKSNISRNYDDLDQYQLRLETQIISVLRKNHAFEKVYPAGDTSSELQIIVTITNLRNSKNYDHFRIGFLAGEAVAEGTLEFRENATGKILASCPLGSNVFGNSDVLSNRDKVTDRMVAQVLDVISHNLANDGSKETVKLQSVEAPH